MGGPRQPSWGELAGEILMSWRKLWQGLEIKNLDITMTQDHLLIRYKVDVVCLKERSNFLITD